MFLITWEKIMSREKSLFYFLSYAVVNERNDLNIVDYNEVENNWLYVNKVIMIENEGKCMEEEMGNSILLVKHKEEAEKENEEWIERHLEKNHGFII